MPTEKRTSIVVCTACNGSGETFTSEFKGHTKGYEKIFEPCKTCGGLRVLEKIEIIKYKNLSVDSSD